MSDTPNATPAASGSAANAAPAAASGAAEARRRLLAKRLRGTAKQRSEGPRLGRGALLPVQERLWVHQQLDPGSTAFSVCEAVRVDGPLDVAALRDAATEVSARHETLRTTFHAEDGVAHTLTHESLPPEVTVLDSTVDAAVTRAVTRPFDLATGPLLRLDVVPDGPAHVLVLSTHHIIADGWSMSLLITELTAAYLRRTGAPIPPPEPLRAHWSDVVRAHRKKSRSAVDAQLDYWRAELHTLPDRPADESAEGGTVPVQLSPASSEALHAACAVHGVTPYMVLLAAFAVVVARRTGTARPIIGMPVAGRQAPEYESLIGYFANTLPISVPVAETGAELWAACRTAVLGALDHQDVSLSEIAGAVSGHNRPLFQALFALQNYPYEPITSDGLTVTPMPLPKPEAKLDLSLYLYERDGALQGYLEHRLARWSTAQATAIAEDVVRTLTAMLADPVAVLDHDLPAAERQRLLDAGAGSVRERPATTVHGLVEASAARTPDAVALVDADGTELSYAALDRRANQLAHRLIASGLQRGQRVAVVLPHGAPLVITLLAVLKAGGAFVPVDPAYPADRVANMTRVAGIVLTIDGELPADDQPTHAPAVGVHPDDLAYVVFTSGSTGVPKGIAVTHRGVVNHNLATVEVFGLTAADRVLHVASPGFDATIEEVFPAFACGATVVARTPDAIDSFTGFDRFVARHRITVLPLPTAYWEGWYEELRAAGTGPARSVRMVTLSGQRVNAVLVRHWESGAATGHVALVNTYGPTEATVTTTTFTVAPHGVAPGAAAAPPRGEIPIGSPWPNYRTYIVDDRFRLVPDGATGELCVGGVGVSLGYLGAPAATADRFVPDPFAPEPGARMYRTGDYVTRRPDGTLAFVGRIDGQVKVRGNRVETGEVEAVLAAHPAVSQCVVVAYPVGAGDHRLGAHVVLREDVTGDQLAAHVAGRLPAYMVPGGFAVHDALPLTPHGKVDRRALPEPEASTSDSEPPAGPTETALAALWREVLGDQVIGRGDDFFGRGGTSLSATALASRIERDLGRALPLRELFANPVLAAMARAVDAAPASMLAPINPVSDTDLPASPAQRRVYLIQESAREATSYNMPMALRVTKPVGPAVVRDALQRLVDRHESLRTTFHLVDGEVRQRVRPHAEAEFTTTEVDEDPDLREQIRPFDLSRDTLLRALWFTTPTGGVLFLDVHHIAADGASVQVLVEEFLALLDGAELPTTGVRYRDFAHWQRLAAPARTPALREHWATRVENLPTLTFPYDHDRPAVRTFAGFTSTFTVDPATTAALSALARDEGATLNIALLAAYAAALARYAGQQEVVIGSLVAGRTHPDVDRVVGMFANFLPLRVSLAPGDTFRTLLDRTRDRALADYDHQDLPFEEIVALAGRRHGHNPLFDTMLIFQEDRGRVATSDGYEALPVEHGTSKLDLKLDVFPEPDGSLSVQAEANAALLEPDTVRRFVEQLLDLCAAAAARPDAPLASLAPLSPAERARIDAARRLDLLVVSSFTADPIRAPYLWWCEQFGHRGQVRFGAFGQVFQELLDPASGWHTHPGPALLLVRFEDWPAEERSYTELLAALRSSTAGPRLVAVLPSELEISRRWHRDLAGLPVTVIDLEAALDRSGVAEWDDPAAFALGAVPYTEEFFAVAGTEVARRVLGTVRAPFKVIAVDADDTLWRGVVGEDGPLGVVVDEPARALQELLLRKRADGMVLVLLSKNAEQDVREVFSQNPGMLMREEHFTEIRANWRPKHENLAEVVAKLGLGLDSVVFLDDSAAECAAMVAALPQVLTFRVPADARFFDHVWAFDTHRVTDEDRQRAERYRAELRRQDELTVAPSLTGFLAGLGLQASFTAATPDELERVAQLTQRTNQFNLSGLRLTRSELDGRLAHVLRVSDRFGDHGLTGVVLSTIADGTLHLDNVLLSCRVLGRTVEEAVLAGIAAVCREHGLDRVTADHTATERNQPARAFLDDYGWRPLGGTRWEIPVSALPEQPTYVTLSRTRPQTVHFGLDHVGVAVRSLSDARAALTAAGFRETAAAHDPIQRSSLAMFERPGSPRVELVAPDSADSPTAGVLDRAGERPYHLCYRVDSIPEAVQSLRAAGISLDAVGEAVPAVLFGGRLVQFFSVAGAGLVELVEGPAEEYGSAVVHQIDDVAAERFFSAVGHGSAELVRGPGGPGPLGLRGDLPAFVAAPPAPERPTPAPRDTPRWQDGQPDVDQLVHRAHHLPLRHVAPDDLITAYRRAGAATGSGEPYVAPRTSTEAGIAAAFEQVLGVDQVGVHDSFFALGGNSLQAVTLLAHLNRTLGTGLRLQQLFEQPTPADLASVPASRGEMLVLPTAPGGRTVPATAAQRRFFVLQRMDPGGTQYHLPHLIELTGDLDVERMRTAFRDLVARHEALRTSFRLDGAELLQVIHDDLRADLTVVTADLTPQEIFARFVRPFDLETAPLARMILVHAPHSSYLLVDIHHSVADGTSLGLLVSEFARLYAGEDLPPVRQYRDWAALERSEQYARRLADSQDYWLTRFADLPEPLDLPADHPRPAVQSAEGDSVRFVVPADVVAGLRRAGQAADTTLFATMLAGLYVTLWRHSGQSDLVVGTPFAGRTVPGTETITGPFLNTLPLRAFVEPGATVADLLGQVRTTVANSLRHQDYPFDDLVERLGVVRDPSRNPLYDVMFAFQNMELADLDLPGVTARQPDVETWRSLFDLELRARPEGEVIECRLDFAVRLFRRETVEAFVRRFLTALAGLATPERPLADLDVLGPEERAALVAGLGSHPAELPAQDTVLSRIEAVAAADPGRTAIVASCESLSYRELVQQAGAVAGLLTGLSREQVVGVLARRGPAMIITMLGVWRAGGAFVLLDPDQPDERQLGMLTDAGCEVVLAQPGLLSDTLSTRFDGRIVPLDTTGTPGAAAPVSLDDLAYVLFTSGSTGRPKGAMVEQRGMINHMLAKVEDVGMDASTALVQNAGPSFDIVVWQCLGALVMGGRTIVVSDEAMTDPRVLLREAAEATVLEVVPSMLEVMLDLLEREPRRLPHLRTLVSTGEALPRPLAARWMAAYPDIALVNSYGPTEASDDIAHLTVNAYQTEGSGSVALGHPIRNARVYVVDRAIPLGPAALVPTGAKGEICVAGPCVGRGYVNDPERTAAAFADDPFEGGRLYRTGDLGRWLPDGTLEFLGRADSQVKLRGHRVELGEIEAALSEDPSVTSAVVLVQRAAGRPERLVGYVVAEPAHAFDERDVLDRVAKSVPGYMVPDVVLRLDRLPLTRNGKIDRKALPEAEWTATTTLTPLSSDTERLVAEIFAEVLGADTSDAEANFFALGGHSLRVVALLVLLQARTGIELPVADVFADPTVRGIAQRVDQVRASGVSAVRVHHLLGRPDDPPVFLFPPIAGWGTVYLGLAESLPGHAVHAFDFVEDDHRVAHYADLVERHANGPLVLGGYSAGGNLAFEVARELESRGHDVSRIVLFDSMACTEAGSEQTAALAARIRADMAEGLALLDPVLQRVLSDPHLQDRAATKRTRYTEYWNSLEHQGSVAAPITLVLAEQSSLDEHALADWRRLTPELTVVEGFGRHAEMMTGAPAEPNARVMGAILGW
ncbi:HAD-superfamily phosphatase, subfamily IIIC/FkbH-like domain-containing protein/amino acid adenylation domain-containing protein [Lentzea fradiae]|uniref:HAD-superfamily phosphatase, subfamily IIIC/FkbH-like domain-containing protein/amino acid adenylation domain-containing protein n=1 Tax=Lentzea fradiae TaxID=200378 RepID=A0A1G7W0R6_9PSEU|nr:non-ribosomal peptide synthetase [Lentzea fradiae]SDG65576.1 HAD-superfamily phosphatase, subfamily IIIC/FkbH-like domain-containing protein/amino acid adenylation domain-containing protein [Lentzea fradiae]